MLLTISRNRLPFAMRREKKVKLSNTYSSVAPAGTSFASRRDSRYRARMLALVSDTDPPSGRISNKSASRSVSGTSIFNHSFSLANPVTSVDSRVVLGLRSARAGVQRIVDPSIARSTAVHLALTQGPGMKDVTGAPFELK